jgi:hypothetical protein
MKKEIQLELARELKIGWSYKKLYWKVKKLLIGLIAMVPMKTK